jgi:hypothetical protein
VIFPLNPARENAKLQSINQTTVTAGTQGGFVATEVIKKSGNNKTNMLQLRTTFFHTINRLKNFSIYLKIMTLRLICLHAFRKRIHYCNGTVNSKNLPGTGNTGSKNLQRCSLNTVL